MTVSNSRHKKITSAQNPDFKKYRSLLEARGIRKYGEAILSGARFTAEAVRLFPDQAQQWICCEDQIPPIVKNLDAISCLSLSSALFAQLDMFGTGQPLLVVSIPEMSQFNPSMNSKKLFLPLQNPENIGAALRCAAAFGINDIVLLRESANPFLPKALRAGGPAMLSLRFFEGPHFADLKLPEESTIILDLNGSPLPKIMPTFAKKRDLNIIVGMEGPGVPKSMTGQRVYIPTESHVESLNASTALAILLYSLYSQGGF